MPTIEYEGSDEAVERHVDDLRYDDTTGHWRFPVGEDIDGNTIYRRVPRERVYFVDKSVDVGSTSR